MNLFFSPLVCFVSTHLVVGRFLKSDQKKGSRLFVVPKRRHQSMVLNISKPNQS